MVIGCCTYVEGKCKKNRTELHNELRLAITLRLTPKVTALHAIKQSTTTSCPYLDFSLDIVHINSTVFPQQGDLGTHFLRKQKLLNS